MFQATQPPPSKTNQASSHSPNGIQKLCSQCQAKQPIEASYCSHCGLPFRDAAPVNPMINPDSPSWMGQLLKWGGLLLLGLFLLKLGRHPLFWAMGAVAVLLVMKRRA